MQKVLKKINLALNEQQDFNVDVKKGVSGLNELLDFIQSHRASWKRAETEQNGHKLRENNSL